MEQLAKDCPQLSQLRFRFGGRLPQNYNFISLFSTFIALTTLEIDVCLLVFELGSPGPVNNNFSIRDLCHLSQLKHLSLALDELSDNCFESIDKYLPQLESIKIDTQTVITDKSLEQVVATQVFDTT